MSFFQAPSGEDQTIGTKNENHLPIVDEIVEPNFKAGQGQAERGGTSERRYRGGKPPQYVAAAA